MGPGFRIQRAITLRHPGVLLLYGGGAAVFAMGVFHPLWAGVSFGCALLCAAFLLGRGSVGRSLRLVLPLMLLVAAANPLVNHQGATLLFYLGRMSVTVESVLYGVCSAFMLGAALLWLRCAGVLLGGGRLMFLLSPLLPGISMVLSLVLRLVPLTRRRLGDISDARLALEGKEATRFRDGLRQGMAAVSALLEWAMEDGLETADAMKARGYGAGRRTSGMGFSWGGEDSVLAGMTILFMGAAVWTLVIAPFTFFPRLTSLTWNLPTVTGVVCYGCFLLLPIWWEGVTALRRRINRLARRNIA